MLPPRRRPWGILVLVGVVLVVVAYLAFSSVGSALVYYVTPTELAAMDDPFDRPVRLGGVVKAGSIRGPATDLLFVLTDGQTEVTVHSVVAPTRSFREGSGAVVQGELNHRGLFEATQVIVKHDENYEAPAPGTQPSDRAFEPGDEP
jgi:cytochrome c-type biogenesis protein CcmE